MKKKSGKMPTMENSVKKGVGEKLHMDKNFSNSMHLTGMSKKKSKSKCK
jgi:hypothetical protein